MLNLFEKQCTKCKEIKSIDEFYTIHHRKYLMSECKECFKKRTDDYRKDHLEEARINKRRYVSKDPKRWSEYTSSWQKEHAELMRVRSKTWEFKKKLKDEFSIDLNLDTKKKTIQQIEEIHAELKKRYQLEKLKVRIV
jgi:hypothetical protein